MNPQTAQELLGMIVAWRRTPLYYDLWFVTCLFAAELIFYWIVRLRKLRFGEVIYWLVLSAFSVTGHYVLKWYKGALPWAVDLVPTVLLFLGSGFWLREKGALWFREKKVGKPGLFSGFILSLGLSIFIACTSPKRMDLYYSVTGGYAVFLIGAYSGIAVILTACSIIGHNKPMEFIGRNSLIFYAAQQYIFLKVTDKMAASLAGSVPILNHFLVKTGISVLLACCGLAICSVCINKCFPFLLGKKRTGSL